MAALKWTTYGDLHRKDPIKVNAGKCRGKSKSTVRKYKNLNEDIKFENQFAIKRTQVLGILSLAFLIVAFILGPEKAWMYECGYKKATIQGYQCVAPKRDLLKGFSLSQVSEVKAEEVKPTPTPEPEITGALELPNFTNDQVNYVLEKKRGDLILKVWRRESTWGTNNTDGSLADYCKKQGQWNEIGYGGMALKLCFSDYKAGFDRLDRWFDERSYMTDAQALCSYNLGPNAPQSKGGSCGYAKDL